MSKVKKFGTFSGVFTPSILTILGVIMYLRFPSIIGQAGLINTIGIIIIAHIISITTSLSVASLSTDKPVQNGGTYFMISRSLGLPIGGTLGFALFVGLSFSVSLYLIGFAESFLQYWGLPNNIQTIRITGSIVLLAVTTITFISTSLAIKSQYFIMVAIGLSLLSIFFGRHDFAPTEVNLAPLATSAPFMLLFGIFFPAVTGFEAGVSMSGDLKDPRKSLPVGAIMAVAVGFVVYIGLAFFYAYTVDADALVNDPEILFKISLVPALVIAGIWGATLSSALGSILGAPRILQAIAMDKIAPKFLAKGTGKTNEPRNALLLAFVIAEAGILIGELDVIARIVSMFFITTYAFLNLASAIESWSSSDFRPAFKIPKFVSILGALSAFIVMILLDFLALAGATIVLGLLYFYLQRKELILESGDAWGSFWSNMAKRSLLKLSANKENTRNWRPNIVLFSGGEKVRPHLVEMGLTISGKLGALTDFNLVNQNAPKQNNFNQKTKSKNTQYFLRQLSCNSIEEGIKTVTSIYGFSGFEPNTVFMGWSNNPNNESFLLNILKDLKNKNMNALFLDYNQEKAFGKKEKIDIWWNGKGRFLSFSLNLLRFLQSSPDWRDSEVRLLIINNDSSINDSLYRNTADILAEKRMKAEIKILSDDFGSRSKKDIIHTESLHSDLILLGISTNDALRSTEYIQSLKSTASLEISKLLLFPSNEFEEINLIEQTKLKLADADKKSPSIALPLLPTTINQIIKGRLESLDNELMMAADGFNASVIDSAFIQMQSIVKNIKEFTAQNIAGVEKELAESAKHEYTKILARNHHSFIRNAAYIFEKQTIKNINEASASIQHGINSILTKLGNDIFEAPKTIMVNFQYAHQKKEKAYDFQYKKRIDHFINTMVYSELKTILVKLEEATLNQIVNIRKILFDINDTYEKLLDSEANKETILADIDISIIRFNVIEASISEFIIEAKTSLQKTIRELVIAIANDLESPQNIKKANRTRTKKDALTTEHLMSFAQQWGKGMQLLNNSLYFDLNILVKKDIALNIITSSNEKIQHLVNDQLNTPLNSLSDSLNKLIRSDISDIKLPNFTNNIILNKSFDAAILKISEILNNLPEELLVPELIYQNSNLVPLLDYVENKIYPRKLASHFVDIAFREPFYRDLEQFKKILEKAFIETKEVCSLVLFNLNNLDKSNKENEFGQNLDKSIYEKLLSQINEQQTKVNTEVDKLHINSNIYLHNAFSKLFYHALTDTENNISSVQRENKEKRINSGITTRSYRIKSQFNALIVNSINGLSSGLLLSKKYLTNQNEQKSPTKELLDLIEQILPNKKVYQMVPVFYRSLMSSSSKINNELWIPRSVEIKQIKDAIKRHKNGIGGALVIKGLHGAGKTTLTRYITQHMFKKNNVFWIDAPLNGSTNTNDFLKTLQKQFVGFDNFEAIFSNMPYESTVVINDLELWWERRPGGHDVIDKIIQLIHRFGNKVFFIINCNSHSYNIIKNMFAFENNTISVINCEPFNAKELHQLILNRHKSSGIALNYQGKNEENISQLNYSLLFNSYFHISDGIPGIALNTWKANIVNFEEDTLTIKKPQRITKENFHQLPMDWILVISLFIQHKNADLEKLVRILNYETSAVENIITGLLNAGVIIKKENNIFTLGKSIEPYLVKYCQTIGII